MTARLRLLDRVTWDGRAIPGDRPAALLALLASHPHGLSDERIVGEVWSLEPPAKPTKALQVLVSRLRTLDRSLVERHDGGYRLGLSRDEVDAWLVLDLVASADTCLRDGAPDRAAQDAEHALEARVGDAGPGPLADLRQRVARDQRGAERVLALALSRCGRAAEALPRLAGPARVLAGRHGGVGVAPAGGELHVGSARSARPLRGLPP